MVLPGGELPGGELPGGELPGGELPGGLGWNGSPASIADDIAAWTASPAMTALLASFGRTAKSLDELEAVSAELWDYRKGRERYEAIGETFSPGHAALIANAAAALGLSGRAAGLPQAPQAASYDHVLVLGGRLSSMRARAALAASTLRNGVQATSVAGLGSLRPLPTQDGLPAAPSEGGLRSLAESTEADGIESALRAAFALTGPAKEITGPDWWVHSYPAAVPVHVLAAPSSRPGARAHTGDTLLGWAELVAQDPAGARLLIVTTDLFVPFQHCDAVRLLGLRYGCRIDTIGVPSTPRTFQLLQEIRSAIRSLQLLRQALP